MIEVNNDDYNKIQAMKSIAICTVTFPLPYYTIENVRHLTRASYNPVQSWASSSEFTCNIDVINGEDVGSKIAYIPWTERRKLRQPLTQYFACLFDKEDSDSLLMLECTRVLNLILSDLGMSLTIQNDPEWYRVMVYDIFDAIKKELENGIKRKSIRLDISIHDGTYVATSEDMPSLFVADKDIVELFKEIPDVIKALAYEGLRHDKG